jgi:hypothetical protein
MLCCLFHRVQISVADAASTFVIEISQCSARSWSIDPSSAANHLRERFTPALHGSQFFISIQLKSDGLRWHKRKIHEITNFASEFVLDAFMGIVAWIFLLEKCGVTSSTQVLHRGTCSVIVKENFLVNMRGILFSRIVNPVR